MEEGGEWEENGIRRRRGIRGEGEDVEDVEEGEGGEG